MTIDYDMLARIKARDAEAAAAPTPLEARDAAAAAVKRAFFDPTEHGVDVTGPGGLERAVAAHFLGAAPPGQGAPIAPPDAHAGVGNTPTPGGADSGAATGGPNYAAELEELRRREEASLEELRAQKAQLGDIATRILALEERQQKRGR